jgi:hypothetical protein
MRNEAIKKKLPKKQSQFPVSWKQLSKSVHSVFNSPYVHVLLVLICIMMTIICLITMHRLNKKLDTSINNRITEELERYSEKMILMENHFLEQTENMERALLTAFNNSSEGTLNSIRNFNATYQRLLEAQKRRTLESLYKEDAIATERRDAAKAFAEGRYVTASRLYGEVATAHPDDQEARFYQYYALFLNNKQDQNNYRIIRDAMNVLERQGYSRREITETLKFIATETGMGEGELQ